MDASRVVDPAKVDHLTAQLYDELRGLARHVLRSERKDHSLQPTALVNEAYLRLVDQATPELQSRTHFLGLAAVVMRQVLVDHARQRNAQKRLGGRVRVTLGDDVVEAGEGAPLDALVMDEALTRLATIDERRAKVVTLRVFGGLTEDEIAELLDLSRTTVSTDWRAARAWLSRELRRHAGEA